MARTYTVVGTLCSSRAEAVKTMEALRALDRVRGVEPKNAWGVAKIVVGDGESPSKMGKIVLPPPALLVRLEGLLADGEVQKTKAGAAALRQIREALKRRK